jgi:hypothetical protein
MHKHMEDNLGEIVEKLGIKLRIITLTPYKHYAKALCFVRVLQWGVYIHGTFVSKCKSQNVLRNGQAFYYFAK